MSTASQRDETIDVEDQTLDRSSEVWQRILKQGRDESESHQDPADDRSLAEWFISMVSSSSSEPPSSMSGELERLKQVSSVIFEEVERGTLTKKEAEALVEFMISGFVGRRMNEVFEGLFDPEGYNKWFMATSRKLYER